MVHCLAEGKWRWTGLCTRDLMHIFLSFVWAVRPQSACSFGLLLTLQHIFKEHQFHSEEMGVNVSVLSCAVYNVCVKVPKWQRRSHCELADTHVWQSENVSINNLAQTEIDAAELSQMKLQSACKQILCIKMYFYMMHFLL